MAAKKKGGNLGKVFFFGILILLGTLIIYFNQNASGKIASDTPKKSLQIVDFYPEKSQKNSDPINLKLPTPTPTKDWGKYCPPDSIKRPDCECLPYENLLPACEYPLAYQPCTSNTECRGVPGGCFQGLCIDTQPPAACGQRCLGKPVIYLYPLFPMLVDVGIKTTGDIFISKPLYPDGGWQNVLAYPNGNLKYGGENYRELFYETNVKDIKKPTNGINIPQEDIEDELARILTLLGLNAWEREEFMKYWVPRLKALNSPNIQFSLITEEEKEKIDNVIITPKPDTFIEILAYFKPLNTPYEGPILVLPENPPLRKGFTAVEWGGTIVKD